MDAEKLKEILDAHGRWLTGEVGGTGANLTRANLAGANLTGANLTRANLTGANLTRANLAGANLTWAKGIDEKTNITGEPWGDYLSRVVPALLTAGGKSLAEVLATGCWDCHSWDNCPMHAAFGIDSPEKGPLLLRPRIEQFVQLFDANLIPKPVIEGEEVATESCPVA